MTEPPVSYRRIDQLKAIAFKHGFTNSDAKQFGKLSKTATWEALLELYLVDGESLETATVDTVDKTPEPLEIACVYSVDSVDTTNWTNDGSRAVCNFTHHNSTSFLVWVDFGQLIAFAIASAGVFMLAMSMWRQINPLNLLPPVRVNIQIGTKL